MGDNIFVKFNNYIINTCNYITNFYFKCMQDCTLQSINNYQVFNEYLLQILLFNKFQYSRCAGKLKVKSLKTGMISSYVYKCVQASQ